MWGASLKPPPPSIERDEKQKKIELFSYTRSLQFYYNVNAKLMIVPVSSEIFHIFPVQIQMSAVLCMFCLFVCCRRVKNWFCMFVNVFCARASPVSSARSLFGFLHLRIQFHLLSVCVFDVVVVWFVS